MAELARISLEEPIEAHGEPVSEIVLREPLLGDLRGIHSGGDKGFDLGSLTTLVARLANIPPVSAAKIPLLKLAPVKERLDGFFG